MNKSYSIEFKMKAVKRLEKLGEPMSDEIMKYKDLLDEGIITEEEFSIKEKDFLRKTIKKYEIIREIEIIMD